MGKTMTELSPVRLWIMRAIYLLMAVGIGANFWPLIIAPPPQTSHMTGVAWALIGTIGLLALLGLRYPAQMIPLLLLELTWKIVWLLAFAMPHWLDGTLEEAMRASVVETMLGLVLLFVIPWRYVVLKYVKQPSEPWSAASSTVASGQVSKTVTGRAWKSKP